jgi:hypothetical protein
MPSWQSKAAQGRRVRHLGLGGCIASLDGRGCGRRRQAVDFAVGVATWLATGPVDAESR